MSNLIRNTLNQLILGAVEGAAKELSYESLGLPPGAGISLTMAKSLAKGVAQTAVLSVYDDIQKRQISKLELSKANYTFDKTEKVFWEFVDKEGDKAGYNFTSDSSEYKYALQVAEGVLMQSMREFEHKKLDVLGSFYGRSLYYGNTQWESIHHTLKMTDRLTYRQIVLIRLICEGFSGIDPELSITTPDACVETMDLINFGIWTTPGAYLSQNNSSPIQIKTLVSTEYAHKLHKELMLDRLPKEDVCKVLDSLCIAKSENTNELITAEDKKTINDSITWSEQTINAKADSDLGTF